MAKSKRYSCRSCFKTPLTRDEIGANKKLLGEDLKSFFCMECLAAFLECEVEDILEKIEQFKSEGCKLFG